MRDETTAKRSKAKRQVWERTLWAIQRRGGSLADFVSGSDDAPDSRILFTSKRAAMEFIGCDGDVLKPVKVRERIEVLG